MKATRKTSVRRLSSGSYVVSSLKSRSVMTGKFRGREAMTERTGGEPDAGDVARLTDRDLLAGTGVPTGDPLNPMGYLGYPAADAVLAALPALGYRKADPARVEAGQPQVVGWAEQHDTMTAVWTAIRTGMDVTGKDAEEITADVLALVPPLVTLADALAYAEQQRQAAVGGGQVVVAQPGDRVRVTVKSGVYEGVYLERGEEYGDHSVRVDGSRYNQQRFGSLARVEVLERAATRPDETREGT